MSDFGIDEDFNKEKMMLTERDRHFLEQGWLYGEDLADEDIYFGDWLKENEQRLADEAPTVDCRQCANRGQINGTSQELVCDSCIHYGSNWRKDMFVQLPPTNSASVENNGAD